MRAITQDRRRRPLILQGSHAPSALADWTWSADTGPAGPVLQASTPPVGEFNATWAVAIPADARVRLSLWARGIGAAGTGALLFPVIVGPVTYMAGMQFTAADLAGGWVYRSSIVTSPTGGVTSARLSRRLGLTSGAVQVSGFRVDIL